MNIEHIALWTNNLETLKDFYCTFFNGVAGEKYFNPQKQFESYFISFDTGARLELMKRPGIAEDSVASTLAVYRGFTHLAFGAASMEEVDAKCSELMKAGFTIIGGPRKTGDGYYEFETLDPDHNRIEVSYSIKN